MCARAGQKDIALHSHSPLSELGSELALGLQPLLLRLDVGLDLFWQSADETGTEYFLAFRRDDLAADVLAVVRERLPPFVGHAGAATLVPPAPRVVRAVGGEVFDVRERADFAREVPAIGPRKSVRELKQN